MPVKVNIDDQKRMHSGIEAAVSFKDGYEVYVWHGLIIQKEWITNPESITKEMFINEKNAEKRRCLKEILGNKKVIELLDVEVIDEDTDGMGHPMKLYRSKIKDELINDYLYFLNVIDPSTEREYYLCVPECKNVWAAKSWTFSNKKIEIRHGDVALLNLKREFDKPIYES
jgi:hypothetical protein